MCQSGACVCAHALLYIPSHMWVTACLVLCVSVSAQSDAVCLRFLLCLI